MKTGRVHSIRQCNMIFKYSVLSVFLRMPNKLFISQPVIYRQYFSGFSFNHSVSFLHGSKLVCSDDWELRVYTSEMVRCSIVDKFQPEHNAEKIVFRRKRVLFFFFITSCSSFSHHKTCWVGTV